MWHFQILDVSFGVGIVNDWVLEACSSLIQSSATHTQKKMLWMIQFWISSICPVRPSASPPSSSSSTFPLPLLSSLHLTVRMRMSYFSPSWSITSPIPSRCPRRPSLSVKGWVLVRVASSTLLPPHEIACFRLSVSLLSPPLHTQTQRKRSGRVLHLFEERMQGEEGGGWRPRGTSKWSA